MDRVSQYPHVRVRGGPHERGRQYGEKAQQRVLLSIRGYQDAFEYYAGWDWRTVQTEALRFESTIESFCPIYLEEMRGIAEGAGVSFEDILALNVRTEIMFAARARKALAHRPRPMLECSSFAVLPEASSGGHTLLGQNWDWLLHCFDTVVILEVAQPDGPDFVTVVEAGLLAKIGMNSSGIGIAANALVTDGDIGEPGVPFHVILRAIFDCETITDVLSTIQRGIRASSANYLVAHSDGIALDVEAAPGDFTRLSLQFPEGGILLHTNHFLATLNGSVDLSLWAMPDSAVRLDRLRSKIGTRSGGLSVQTLASTLSDHADYPFGVCCHPDVRVHPLERGATVASVIIDLDDRRMWLADGHPCSTPYRPFDYRDFLSKPSRLRAGKQELVERGSGGSLAPEDSADPVVGADL